MKKHPSRKNALTPQFRLVLSSHYQAEGMTMREIARNFVIGRSSVHYVIKETCEVIRKVLMHWHIYHLQQQQDLKAMKKEFFKRWNIPNCIGAVDGKHIPIQAPPHTGTDYFSYKKSFSLVLMAVCDSYYKLVMVDIGAQGSLHDSTIFRESSIGMAFLQDKLPIPPAKQLPGPNTTLLHSIVGHQAFPLHEKIMRPYPGENLSSEKTIFNYRLSRARRTIENTFGILVQRWGILKSRMNAEIIMCETITKACVVLHNFLQSDEESLPENERRYCPTGLVDHEKPDGHILPGAWRQASDLRSVRRLGSNNASKRARSNRDLFCNFFNSPAGSIPCQMEITMKGSVPIQMD